MNDEPEFESDLNIHRAAPGDAGLVREITDAAYVVHVPALGRKPQPMTADHHEMLARPGHDIWLLDKSGRGAGVLVRFARRKRC